MYSVCVLLGLTQLGVQRVCVLLGLTELDVLCVCVLLGLTQLGVQCVCVLLGLTELGVQHVGVAGGSAAGTGPLPGPARRPASCWTDGRRVARTGETGVGAGTGGRGRQTAE